MSATTSTSSNSFPSRAQIVEACQNVARNLGTNKYALVGGAACQVLGSTRITEDVDFVVPKGSVPSARKLLAADKGWFDVESRTLHTYFKSTPRIEIEILSPPGTFREDFGQDTATMEIEIEGNSVSVLHPLLILNAKCGSILGRATEAKKNSDAIDIQFLLGYLVKAGIPPTPQTLPNVSAAFIQWFTSKYGEKKLWGNFTPEYLDGAMTAKEQ